MDMKKLLLAFGIFISVISLGHSKEVKKNNIKKPHKTILKSYECEDEEDMDVDYVENPDTGKMEKRNFDADEQLRKMEDYRISK